MIERNGSDMKAYQRGYEQCYKDMKDSIEKALNDMYYSEDAVNMGGEYQGLWVRWRTIEKILKGVLK